MTNQEIISAYLAGDLDLLNTGEFELRLKDDPDFALEVKEARENLLMAKAVERAALKAELSEAFASRKAPANKVRPMWMAGGLMALAAAILLLIWIGPLSQPTEPGELALSYLEPYPAPAQRGDGLAEALAKAPRIPNDLIRSLHTGEKTGGVPEGLRQFALWLNENTERLRTSANVVYMGMMLVVSVFLILAVVIKGMTSLMEFYGKML